MRTGMRRESVRGPNPEGAGEAVAAAEAFSAEGVYPRWQTTPTSKVYQEKRNRGFDTLQHNSVQLEQFVGTVSCLVSFFSRMLCSAE